MSTNHCLQMNSSTLSLVSLSNFLKHFNKQTNAPKVVGQVASLSTGYRAYSILIDSSANRSCPPKVASYFRLHNQRGIQFISHRFLPHGPTMTNKVSKVLSQTNFIETNHLKKINNSQNGHPPTTTQLPNNARQHQHQQQTNNFLCNSPNFSTMAAVQKLALEPTREHIENIRHLLKKINAKDNNDQSITTVKDNESGIASVCIRSAAKNGISCKMMSDLLDIVDDLYSWQEGKGVILYGHNGFFCSGGDLVSVKELANYEDGLKMATFMQYILGRFQSLPMITMAFIQGKAIGGGAEVAVTTDLRVMTKSAKFGYVHCRVGIVAAWGGGSRLVQLVGPSRAIELMSSGRLVDAEEALRYGLANEIIDDTNLSDEEVMAAAKKYLSNHIIGAKSTITAMKGLINAARTLPLESALVVEGQILSSTWGKPPHLEALNNNIKHRGE